jgi:hypothetical protein
LPRSCSASASYSIFNRRIMCCLHSSILRQGEQSSTLSYITLFWFNTHIWVPYAIYYCYMDDWFMVNLCWFVWDYIVSIFFYIFRLCTVSLLKSNAILVSKCTS